MEVPRHTGQNCHHQKAYRRSRCGSNRIDGVSAAAATWVQFPAWCSELRIRSCVTAYGRGCNSGLGFDPWPGNSMCPGAAKKEKKKKKSTNNKYCRGRGEKGTLLHCWWERKLVQPLGGTVWRLLRKLNIEPRDDPAIPLLGRYREETIIWKDTHTPMFTAALFTRAKTWKPPNCPSTDERVKKLCIYTKEYDSPIKRMKLRHLQQHGQTRDYYTKWSQTEKDKYHMKSRVKTNFLAETNENK